MPAANTAWPAVMRTPMLLHMVAKIAKYHINSILTCTRTQTVVKRSHRFHLDMYTHAASSSRQPLAPPAHAGQLSEMHCITASWIAECSAQVPWWPLMATRLAFGFQPCTQRLTQRASDLAASALSDRPWKHRHLRCRKQRAESWEAVQLRRAL
jgi:hypothetical protein